MRVTVIRIVTCVMKAEVGGTSLLERATNQGMQAASRRWESRKTHSPVEPPEGTLPCRQLYFPEEGPLWTPGLRNS